MKLRHQPGRARGAIRAVHAAAIVTGLAVGLAAMRRPAEAVLAGAVAGLLISLALLWALKQEDKR